MKKTLNNQRKTVIKTVILSILIFTSNFSFSQQYKKYNGKYPSWWIFDYEVVGKATYYSCENPNTFQKMYDKQFYYTGKINAKGGGASFSVSGILKKNQKEGIWTYKETYKKLPFTSGYYNNIVTWMTGTSKLTLTYKNDKLNGLIQYNGNSEVKQSTWQQEKKANTTTNYKIHLKDNNLIGKYYYNEDGSIDNGTFNENSFLIGTWRMKDENKEHIYIYSDKGVLRKVLCKYGNQSVETEYKLETEKEKLIYEKTPEELADLGLFIDTVNIFDAVGFLEKVRKFPKNIKENIESISLLYNINPPENKNVFADIISPKIIVVRQGKPKPFYTSTDYYKDLVKLKKDYKNLTDIKEIIHNRREFSKQLLNPYQFVFSYYRLNKERKSKINLDNYDWGYSTNDPSFNIRLITHYRFDVKKEEFPVELIAKYGIINSAFYYWLEKKRNSNILYFQKNEKISGDDAWSNLELEVNKKNCDAIRTFYRKIDSISEKLVVEKNIKTFPEPKNLKEIPSFGKKFLSVDEYEKIFKPVIIKFISTLKESYYKEYSKALVDYVKIHDEKRYAMSYYNDIEYIQNEFAEDRIFGKVKKLQVDKEEYNIKYKKGKIKCKKAGFSDIRELVKKKIKDKKEGQYIFHVITINGGPYHNKRTTNIEPVKQLSVGDKIFKWLD